MGDKTHKGRFRFVDFLVILLCLSGAAYSVNLFRVDLLRVYNSLTEKPVGVIIVKNNVVQRRLADRVLWDRLAVDSPAYAGDVIRTASHSAATLRIENNIIEMDENTLIRILRTPGADGSYRIELGGGNLSVSTKGGGRGRGAGITLSVMGRDLGIKPDTVLIASAGDGGVVLQVNEGSASFAGDEQEREISSGTLLSLDTAGTERVEKAAMVLQPSPNARYLKSTPGPLPVNFSWIRVNLDPGETLRLEIAEDRSFDSIVSVIDNLDAAAVAAFDTGFWYWKLSLSDAGASQQPLATGRLTVTDASGPRLLSPVTDSVFSYRDELPRLRFNWSETEEASSYILEVSNSPDFINPRLQIETDSVFYLNAGLGQGAWYWRVEPVFPPVYEGSAAFSPASIFRIEQGGREELILPEPVPVQPEPIIEQPEPETAQPEPVVEQPVPVPVRLSLRSPAQGASLPGLTALRQQTEFTWDSDGAIAGSRFIISRNSNPLQGRPVREINNPGRTIRLNLPEAGVYYWTIEARSTDGIVSVAPARQLRVLAIPLLPAPANMQPPQGYRIGIEELETQNNIIFTWPAVQGANAYVFTLYEGTANGRQIVNRVMENRTWTLELNNLGRGVFVWRVEAVNRNSSGAIQQRGSVGERTFILDIPATGQVHIEDPGILYGY